MGFNKRFATLENAKIIWKNKGKEGIINYFEKCDALILERSCDNLYEYYKLNDWDKIKSILEKDGYPKEALHIGDVSHSKNLTLLETIENIKQLPQVQYDLQRQLKELRVMANKLGLYDAADFIKSYCG